MDPNNVKSLIIVLFCSTLTEAVTFSFKVCLGLHDRCPQRRKKRLTESSRLSVVLATQLEHSWRYVSAGSRGC